MPKLFSTKGEWKAASKAACALRRKSSCPLGRLGLVMGCKPSRHWSVAPFIKQPVATRLGEPGREQQSAATPRRMPLRESTLFRLVQKETNWKPESPFDTHACMHGSKFTCKLWIAS